MEKKASPGYEAAGGMMTNKKIHEYPGSIRSFPAFADPIEKSTVQFRARICMRKNNELAVSFPGGLPDLLNIQIKRALPGCFQYGFKKQMEVSRNCFTDWIGNAGVRDCLVELNGYIPHAAETHGNKITLHHRLFSIDKRLSFKADLYVHYLVQAIDLIFSYCIDSLVNPGVSEAILRSRLYRRIKRDAYPRNPHENIAVVDRKKALTYIMNRDIQNGLRPDDEMIDNTLNSDSKTNFVDKKCFVFDSLALISEKGICPQESIGVIHTLISSGKSVVIMASVRRGRILHEIENAIDLFIDKCQRFKETEHVDFSAFENLLLYTDGGALKYCFSSETGKFSEDRAYRETFSDAQISAVLDLLGKETAGQASFNRIRYKRADGKTEQFAISNLKKCEHNAIISLTDKVNPNNELEPVLPDAVTLAHIQPKEAVNLSEPPNIYYMLYGMQARAYYSQRDPKFVKRGQVVKQLTPLVKKIDRNIKVEIGGSRAIALRKRVKRDSLKDAIEIFGIHMDDVVCVVDATEKTTFIHDMIGESGISVINIGAPLDNPSNNTLQNKYFNGLHGTLALFRLISFLPAVRAERDFRDNIFAVLKQLLENPAVKSEIICNSLNMNKKELVSIYRVIRETPVFKNLLLHNSRYPHFVDTLCHDMLTNINRLKRIIHGDELFPLIVEIHPGKICNSNCTMCYSKDIDYLEREISLDGKKHPTRNHLIKKEDIKRLLDECKKGGAQEIWFSGGKEPLMSAATVYAIKTANDMGFVTRLYSNGELMTEAAMEALLYSRQVRFSLNACSAETYDKIHFPVNSKSSQKIHHRRNKNIFIKVKNNISRFVRMRDDKINDPRCVNKPKVRIMVSQIIQPLNCHELLDFVLMASKMGVDSVEIRAESVGKVRPFTENEKRKIISAAYEIERRQYLGELGNISIDLRGLSENELYAVKEKEQFLVGMKRAVTCKAGMLKRGVDAYCNVFHCEFAMHPQNAKTLPYSLLKLGNLKKNSFKEIMAAAKDFSPPVCTFCQQHEYGMNIALEKISDDNAFGIDLHQQPYYANNDIVIIGMGRWGSGPTIAALDKIVGKESYIYGVAGANYEEVKKKFSANRRINILHRHDLDRVLARKEIRAVVISTQFKSHYELTRKALLAGKHVFVEKPFVETPDQEKELINIARDRNLTLNVGYVYMNEYDFFKIRRLIRSGYLGEIRKVDLTMLNPVAGRRLDYSSNVIEDLAIHKFSMLLMMLGPAFFQLKHSEMIGEKAEIALKYGGVDVAIHLDRDFKGKHRKRRIVIMGEEKTLEMDYAKLTGDIIYKIYDKMGDEIKTADSHYPRRMAKNDGKEFMEAEFRTFIEAIQTGKTPINSADATTIITALLYRCNELSNVSRSAGIQ